MVRPAYAIGTLRWVRSHLRPALARGAAAIFAPARSRSRLLPFHDPAYMPKGDVPLNSSVRTRWMQLRTGAVFALRAIALSLLVFTLPDPLRAQSPDNGAAAEAPAGAPAPSQLEVFLGRLPEQVGESPDAFRERGTQLFMAQKAAVALLAEEQPDGVPEIIDELARIRSGLSLEYLLSRQVVPQAPTTAEVDAFIAENTRLFEGRANFSFATYYIRADTDRMRQTVQGSVDRLSTRPRVASGDLQGFAREMQAFEVPFVGQTRSANSEQLPGALLTRLEQMAAARRSVALTEVGEVLELLVLLNRRPEPVDPLLMRPQIAEGLARTTMERQRAAVIADLASQYRLQDDGAIVTDPEAARPVPSPAVPRPLSRTETVLRALTAAGGAFAALAAAGLSVLWFLAVPDNVRARQEGGVRPGATGYPRIYSPAVRLPLAALFALVPVALNLRIGQLAMPGLDQLVLASAVSAGAVTALLGVGLLAWGRNRPDGTRRLAIAAGGLAVAQVALLLAIALLLRQAGA
jgi:hypothetical protein